MKNDAQQYDTLNNNTWYDGILKNDTYHYNTQKTMKMSHSQNKTECLICYVSGLYYKRITIVIDAPSVVSK